MANSQALAEGKVDEIVESRFFPGVNRGVFVDVGAGRPFYLSVSALFRAHGWRVIAIEPNPSFCEEHRAAGHEIFQYACSDHDQDSVSFSIVNSQGAGYAGGNVTYESFSSLGIKDTYRSLNPPEDVQTISVNVRKLNTILQAHTPDVPHIDILSVDVEGWELEVLKGLSLARYQPSVLIVENLFSQLTYVEQMRHSGYYLWKRIYPNDVYVARDALGFFERVSASLKYLLRKISGRRGGVPAQVTSPTK